MRTIRDSPSDNHNGHHWHENLNHVLARHRYKPEPEGDPKRMAVTALLRARVGAASGGAFRLEEPVRFRATWGRLGALSQGTNRRRATPCEATG